MTTFALSVPRIDRATPAPRLSAIVKAVRSPDWPTQSHAFSLASDHDVSSIWADGAATIAAATSHREGGRGRVGSQRPPRGRPVQPLGGGGAQAGRSCPVPLPGGPGGGQIAGWPARGAGTSRRTWPGSPAGGGRMARPVRPQG